MIDVPVTRRRLLASAAVGAGALMLSRWPVPARAAAPVVKFAVPLPRLPELSGSDIVLRAAEADVSILPGTPTRMWTYNGSFPGPVIRRPSGTPTRVTLQHDLAPAGPLTLHHHGAHSAPAHDGQPRPEVMVAPGTTREYLYELMDDGAPERAATQWYHDHSHGTTGRNTWRGLAGMFIVEDEVEAALPLPRGEYELPLIISDRGFDANNQLTDPISAARAPFDDVAGNVFLVNGAPQPHAEVAARRYRVRILNASNFRPYLLRLTGDGSKLWQIGTESGLLPAPVRARTVSLGPGERVDLIADFSDCAGQSILLESVSPTGSVRRPATDPAVVELVEFRVGAPVPDESSVPQALRPLPDWAASLSTTPDRIWTFGVGAGAGGPAWTINGREFDHSRVDAQPELGTTETWMLVNTTPYPMSHWIHIHDVDWVVLERNGRAPAAHEAGLKETFRLDPGEVLVVGTKFTDHTGPYMLHCHMLEHEDHGMMGTFEVVEPGTGSLLPGVLPAAGRRRTADPLDALTNRERRCVQNILAQIERRPGRPARVRGRRRSAAPASSLVCKV